VKTLFFNKRGIMGIGTLIIFIATILVAAVAAAVLISTSNVLQQRSLLVGQEARKTITDGVDIISVTAATNSSTESFNNFEIMLRLSPGSDPLQMRRFDIQLLSNLAQTTAMLWRAEVNGDNDYSPGEIGTTAVSIGADLDDDGINDRIILVDGSGANDTLYVNLSSDGISDPINLGIAVDSGVRVRLSESAIKIGETLYGTVEVDGLGSAENTLHESAVTVRSAASACEFDLLPVDDYYCYEVLIGDSDTVLDSREKYRIKYKLSSSIAPTVGQDFLFILSSEKGRMTEVRARTPDVVTYARVRLWPLD
jgi:flagellin-like protein